MSKNSFIIICISFLLFFPFIIKGQSKISDAEKKELEDRFKALKTYYIRDDGTVAFYTNQTEGSTKSPAADNSYSNSSAGNSKTSSGKRDPGRVKVKVSVDASGDYVVSKEEPEVILNHPSIIKEEEPEDIAEAPIFFEAPKVERHEPAHVEPESPPVAITRSESKNSNNNSPKTTVPESTATQKPTSATKSTSGSTNKSKGVFKRKESSYKTLEEAAMAVDDLLDQLKRDRDNNKNNRKNSLSSRLSGGVDGSLRQNSDAGYYIEKSSDNADDVMLSSEPTYYINGIKATAEAYRLLETKDILRKERRVSKSNPHGEWWIETRQR